MIKNRTLGWVFFSIVVLICLGCNSTSHLNESSGKHMLQAKMVADQKNEYILGFGNIRPTLNQTTRTDYSQGTFPTELTSFVRMPNPEATVQRLLRSGYISQSQSTFTVPNVSGEYHVELTWPKNSWTGRATYAVTLEMKPTFNSLTGHYHVEGFYAGGGHAMTADGPIAGSVDKNGVVHISYNSQYGSTKADYTFKGNNGEESLTGNQPFLTGMPVMTLIAHGPGGEITVPMYSYTLSNKFEPLPPPHQDQIDGGKIEIDQLSTLLLSSETMAQASFGWHVDFNDAAKALSGQEKVSGTGQVVFGKQPDGNWVVAGYNL